jgi:hypothetical protein
VIDDTDNRGINGREFLSERFAGGATLEHDNDALAHTGAHRINGQQCCTPGIALWRLGLHEQQLRALELGPLLRRDDGTHHSGQDHCVE